MLNDVERQMSVTVIDHSVSASSSSTKTLSQSIFIQCLRLKYQMSLWSPFIVQHLQKSIFQHFLIGRLSHYYLLGTIPICHKHYLFFYQSPFIHCILRHKSNFFYNTRSIKRCLYHGVFFAILQKSIYKNSYTHDPFRRIFHISFLFLSVLF